MTVCQRYDCRARKSRLASAEECWGELKQQRIFQLKNIYGERFCRPVVADPSGDKVVIELLHKVVLELLHRATMFRGTDIRMGSGIPCDPIVWPRKKAEPWRWSGHVVLAYPQQGQQINILEMRATFRARRWRFQFMDHIHCRFVHLSDSVVRLAFRATCRTSSKVLHRALKAVCNTLGR